MKERKETKKSKESSSSNSDNSLHLPSSDEDPWAEFPPNKDSDCDLCKKSCQNDKTWVLCLQCDLIWAHKQCLPRRQAIFVCESCNSQ